MYELFSNTIDIGEEKGWDTIYIAIDWHDTITESTYDNTTALKFTTNALKALQLLSFIPKFKLILFTSSYMPKCMELIDVLATHNITIDWVNENPEVENTDFGDFSSKFYYNILLDDKAGFKPDDDWGDVIEFVVNYITKEYKV